MLSLYRTIFDKICLIFKFSTRIGLFGLQLNLTFQSLSALATKRVVQQEVKKIDLKSEIKLNQENKSISVTTSNHLSFLSFLPQV